MYASIYYFSNLVMERKKKVGRLLLHLSDFLKQILLQREPVGFFFLFSFCSVHFVGTCLDLE